MSDGRFERTFSWWIRSKLKSSWAGLIAQDIDFMLPIDGELFVLEEKNLTRQAGFAPVQQVVFDMFERLSKNAVDKVYAGAFLVRITSEEVRLSDLLGALRKAKTKGYCRRGEQLSVRKFTGIDPKLEERLWDCKGVPKGSGTRRERSNYRGSIIGRIRGIELKPVEKGLWIFLNYCSGFYILVKEEADNKVGGNKSLLKWIDNLFHFWDEKNRERKRIRNPKSGALYRYLGLYRINFGGGRSPAGAGSIYLNDIRVSEEKLKDLLNLESDRIKIYRGT